MTDTNAPALASRRRANPVIIACREFARLVRLCVADRATRSASLLFLGGVIGLITLFAIASLLRDNLPLAAQVYEELDLGSDDSLSEKFTHGLSFLAATLFLICFLHVGSRAAFFLASLSAFVWFDDAARFHERVGTALKDHIALEPRFGLRLQDYGEIVAWLGAACVLGLILLWALRALRPGDLGLLLATGLCFAVLVFFGVVVDMVHVTGYRNLLMLIEDGGEMIAVTGFAAVAIGALRQADRYFDP